MADTAYSGSASKPLSQLQTAGDLLSKVDSLKNSRHELERNWKLNLAFYRGKQHASVNPVTKQINILPTEDGQKPKHRVRFVSNQIVTGVHSLLAKLTKSKPVMFASPGSADYTDLRAAQLAERLLEFWWEEFDLSAKMEEAILWSLIAGQGYWKINWDPYAGAPMKVMIAPDGQPVIDDFEKTVLQNLMQSAGAPAPEERTVYMGDIKVEVLSPDNVFVDNAAKVFEDAKYVFCRHFLDPDEIRVRYQVDVEPDAVPAELDVPLPFANSASSLPRTVKEVWIGYFKPSPAVPEGRMVTFIKNPDQILQDGPWPYPFQDLPLVKFPGIRVPGSVYDDAIVTHARPIQQELNKTLSQIIVYKNLMIAPRVWAPLGSVRTKLSNEPGVVRQFIPIQGMRPEPEDLPSLPPYVFEHLKDISQRLNETFNMVEVTQGQVPPNVEAGIAIDLLQEMATDRLAPTVKLIELAVGQAGKLMLSFAQAYYNEPRMMKVYGSGGTYQTREFSKADISGSIDVRVEAGSGLPRTRAGRQTRVLQLVQLGLVPLERAYKYLDLADIRGLTSQFEVDEQAAFREHDKILAGQPLNPDALTEAFTAIAAGMNPETNEALMSISEAQEVLERASLMPGPADNNVIHVETHGAFLKSPEYEKLPPELRRRFRLHYELTKERIPQPTGENDPKVNLNVRAAAGPTMLSEILRRTGVQVAPEVIAIEPPTETWVTDSVDKPDADVDVLFPDPQMANQLQFQHTMSLNQAELRKKMAEADLAEKKAEQGPPQPNNNRS